MRTKFFFLRRNVAACIIAVVTLAACSRATDRDANAQLQKLLVPRDTILEIKEGEALSDVERTFGVATRFEFCVPQGDNKYTLIGCLGPTNEFSTYLLFQNDRFEKFIEVPSAHLEVYPFEGTTATRIKSWPVDDQGQVIETIAAPPLSRGQLVSNLTPNSHSESWNVAPAFLFLIGTPVSSRYAEDIQRNSKLLAQYDGCHANLGMDAQQIDQLFGKPLRVFSDKNGQTVNIYGDDRELQVPPMAAFTGLAIVSDSSGHVVAIYGDGFFNGDWKNADGKK